MSAVSATIWRFRCPECGFGDIEVAHLTRGDEAHCVVCLEEDGRRVMLCWWEDAGEAEAPVRHASAAA